jgi:hypothetical protein
MAGIAHWSFSGLPETLSPPFSPLYPWIHGLFPAIEFTVAPSSPLPNSGDPVATLACASLNSGNFTAAERSGAACSRLFPRSDPLRPILIERLGPRVPLRARAPDALSRLSAPPAAAHPSRSNFPRLILIERLGPLQLSVSPLALGPLGQRALPFVADTPCPACQRSPAHTRALGRRSNLGRRFLI